MMGALWRLKEPPVSLFAPQKCQQYTQARQTYQQIIKHKQLPHSGRLRVNLGNVFFGQQLFAEALRNYRTVLDQVRVDGSLEVSRVWLYRCIG